MYFTIAKNDYGYLIDSISNNYRELRCKFPNDEIYYSDSPILSIYIIKEQLNKVNGSNEKDSD